MLLELDDAVLIERLLARGRDDDNEVVIRNRLEVYREKTSLDGFTRSKAYWCRSKRTARLTRSQTDYRGPELTCVVGSVWKFGEPRS